jgi:precorrin-2 dehydrogenase/sirohydrochlorin ferrochelatase
MAELTAEIRANLKERGVSPATRRRAVRQVVRDSNVWKALGTGRANARRRATEVVSDVAGDEQ